jgi:two-component system, NtrC family, response regulator AtoC
MAKQKILVLDDDKMIRWSLSQALRAWDYQPVEAATVAEALDALDGEQPAAALFDVNLPDGSGLDALRELKARQPHAIAVMMTGDVHIEDTIAALRLGAYDFIRKPIKLEELEVTIRNGLETLQLRREVQMSRSERARRFGFDQIVGESPAIREMLALARKVAASEVSSVLLQGESGTGKDLVAKAAHYASTRSAGPFVAINCAAIPANLLESELFGYEKGAFTDAKARKEGLFEQAEGGTLFLDEIGELELPLQAKLLRVLEEGVFRRVGGLRDTEVDARILAASNRDLRTESEGGRFRLDLYYRLSVIQIDIPPLRERGEDVLLLARHYVKVFAEKLRTQARQLSPEVEALFRAYRWPGNVRELRNVIERAMILEEGDIISTKYLPKGLAPELGVPGPGTAAASAVPDRARFRLPPGGLSLEDVEMSLVRQAMEQSGGNQTRAAELLGISRDQLRYRLKKLEAEPAPDS